MLHLIHIVDALHACCCLSGKLRDDWMITSCGTRVRQSSSVRATPYELQRKCIYVFQKLGAYEVGRKICRHDSSSCMWERQLALTCPALQSQPIHNAHAIRERVTARSGAKGSGTERIETTKNMPSKACLEFVFRLNAGTPGRWPMFVILSCSRRETAVGGMYVCSTVARSTKVFTLFLWAPAL